MSSALPQACHLPRETLQRRLSDLRESLLPRVVHVAHTPGHLSFALPLDAQNVAAAEDFVRYERGCCDFARFECRRDPAHGRVWVDVRADAEHHRALADMAEMLRRTPGRMTAEPSGGGRGVGIGIWGVGVSVVGLAKLHDGPSSSRLRSATTRTRG